MMYGKQNLNVWMILLGLVYSSGSTEISRNAFFSIDSDEQAIFKLQHHFNNMTCFHRCLSQSSSCSDISISSYLDQCHLANSKCNSCQRWNQVDIAYTRLPKSEFIEYESCKEVRYLGLSDGVYKLRTLGKHYCQVSKMAGCSVGGWTLALTAKGDNDTFKFSSKLWNNTEVFDVTQGLLNPLNTQGKYAAYSQLPLTKICLGMKQVSRFRWIEINKKANSLQSVFRGNTFQQTSVGRLTWLSLLSGVTVQNYCFQEGFNIKGPFSVRIGMRQDDNDSSCNSHDSLLGIGIEGNIGGKNIHTTVGSEYRWLSSNQYSRVIGYLFVR